MPSFGWVICALVSASFLDFWNYNAHVLSAFLVLFSWCIPSEGLLMLEAGILA